MTVGQCYSTLSWYYPNDFSGQKIIGAMRTDWGFPPVVMAQRWTEEWASIVYEHDLNVVAMTEIETVFLLIIYFLFTTMHWLAGPHSTILDPSMMSALDYTLISQLSWFYTVFFVYSWSQLIPSTAGLWLFIISCIQHNSISRLIIKYNLILILILILYAKRLFDDQNITKPGTWSDCSGLQVEFRGKTTNYPTLKHYILCTFK